MVESEPECAGNFCQEILAVTVRWMEFHGGLGLNKLTTFFYYLLGVSLPFPQERCVKLKNAAMISGDKLANI